MPIISLSISDDLAADFESFARRGDLGKSEIARAALSAYINANYRALLDPKKEYLVSLSVVCAEKHKHAVHEILHAAVVRSQFHLCLSNKRCMEVFGVQASGKQLMRALNALERLPKIEKIQVCLDK